MKALLLILALAMPAGAQQVFPSDIKDPDVLRNMEFLLEQFNILRSSIANNAAGAPAGSTETYREILYSSGTSGFPMTVVFLASTTYVWDYSIKVTSGSTATADLFPCRVNGDATAGNYIQKGTTYPTSRAINNHGASASISLYYQSGGTVSSGDMAQGHYRVESNMAAPTKLVGNGLRAGSESAMTGYETGAVGFLYQSAGPWTFSCAMISGYGNVWESTVYQVGETRP